MDDMEDAVVEDEFGEEAPPPPGDHPNLVNVNPNFLVGYYYTATTFMASYGWFMLFGTVVCFIIWSNIERKVKKTLGKLTKRNDVEDLDPEVLAKRAEAMEIARQKMQEKASASVKRDDERRKELEEKRRLEKLQDYDALHAGKSLVSTQRKLQMSDNQPKPQPSTSNQTGRPSRPLRNNDYNPLMDEGGRPRYRPSPRRTGGG